MVKKRAYLYCRTAHPDKDALEAQKRNLTAYAEAQDFTITGVVSESGSGLDYSRAGLHEAMWAVAEKDVDVLLIANLSRLGRDTYKNEALLRWTRECGVSIVCADGTVPQTFSEILNNLVHPHRISCAQNSELTITDT